MNRLSKVILSLIISFTCAAVLSAEIKLQSQLSDSTLIIGDQITLQLKVDGAKQGVSLRLPSLEGFSFSQLGPPTATSQTVITNGRVESFSGLVYRIGISATRKGVYKVPGIEVEYNGKIYRSQPFDIHVREPNQETKMRMVASLSRDKIYLQQMVTLTLKWYLQNDIEDYAIQFPLLEQKDSYQLKLSKRSASGTTVDLSVSGFKVPFSRKHEQFEGEAYTVYRVDFDLFPPDTGTISLPAASVKAMIRDGSELRQDLFGRTIRSPKLRKLFAASKPLQITVLPIPTKNRPEAYTGGVGRFSVATSVDFTRVKVGDPIELTIKISGNGRYDKIEQPILSGLPEFKQNFAVVDSLQPGDIKPDGIIFKQTIRPRHDEIAEIPPVPFSFFNPDTERFQTVTSQPIPVKVLPAGVVKKEDIVLPEDRAGVDPAILTRETKGIYANYVFEDALKQQSLHAAWFLLFTFPPALYLLIRFAVARRKQLENDRKQVRAKAAKKLSKKRLKSVQKLLTEEGDTFYLGLSKTLGGYLADKLDLGAGEVTTVDISRLADGKKISHEIGDSLVSYLEEIDRLRFSGASQSKEERQNHLKRLTDLMNELERNL